MLLSSEWKHWIVENVGRGCSAVSMVDAMVNAGVDPVTARLWANAAQTGSIDSADMSPSLDVGHASGNYIYGTARLPHSGNLLQAGDRDVRVAMRIAQPVVAVFDGLLSEQECDELIRLSRVKLQRSTIVDPQSGHERFIDARSSHGTFFAINETAFIAGIDGRISELLRWPVENGEGLQILNYRVGGEYKTHFDFFPPGDPGSSAHLAKGGQRVSSLVIYLNDVQQGGETIFPEIHLSVVPRKGSAVYFEYCNERGQVDARTLHGGKPVLAGEKWIATKWMRQRPYR